MADIKRNDTTGPIPPTETVKNGEAQRRILPGATQKPTPTQVHFGNVESLKLKMLDEINQGIRTLIHILDSDGSKRVELLNAYKEENGKSEGENG